MSPTVDALLPLSFLEAVRHVDSPEEDVEAELVSDLRNKRFGLSDTVYMQIRRFTDAVKRRQRTSHDEAVGLATLIGRRPDAEAVFRAAACCWSCRHSSRARSRCDIPADWRRGTSMAACPGSALRSISKSNDRSPRLRRNARSGARIMRPG
jgi:hypothetical protein